MKVRTYIKDKSLAITIFIILLFILSALQMAFKVNRSCIIAETVLMLFSFSAVLAVDYWKRDRFYKDFLMKLDNMDQKYLITEMLDMPEFEEARILKESLYEIDKSMKEKINKLNKSNKEFKEYLEMWIHEIKLPLASLTLMNYNGNTNPEKEKMLIKKIEHYVEQILFMARSDAAEKDYLLKKCNLESSVNKVVVANKELLIESKISVEKQNLDMEVTTDSKWLEFILGQIISNSVKYVRDNDRKIKFAAYEEENKTIFTITDNGMGIASNDIVNVFEKTFTGTNGRRVQTSTGMGLYICRKLCEKMGHHIWIESKEGQYTKVYLEFGKEKYYSM
ncbi:MAG: ATP-binding protein [Eubacterium sp.]